jgi:hypothetical protein
MKERAIQVAGVEYTFFRDIHSDYEFDFERKGHKRTCDNPLTKNMKATASGEEGESTESEKWGEHDQAGQKQQ